MNEKMYASNLKSSSAVGMSPYKGNWNTLIDKLKYFKNGYALDESQYDSSLRSYLMWACALLRWNMYKQKHKTAANWIRLKQYYRNLVWSLIIGPDGVIVMKKGGNPSGSVNTISDNTLILYALLAYAWCMLVPEGMQSLAAFEEHTAKALVGDDNTWTVSDVAHEWFNARTVIEVWKGIGITTTTDSLEPRPAEDLDFLSAHTVFIAGKAVPLYDREKLMTSLLYAPKKDLTPATTLERCAGLLSIGWVDIPFRRFCKEVIEWLLEEYDEVLRDEPRWIAAKSQLASDDKYQRLFLGEKRVFLGKQSISGGTLKINKPDKSEMNASARTNAPRRKRNRKKVVFGPQTKAQAKRAAQPRKRQRQRKRNNNNRPRNGGPGGMTRGPRPGLSRRSCMVTEHEFIYDVVGNGTNFGIVNGGLPFPINPGQSTTFPWLSAQAKQWERYKIQHLKIEYRREVSEFATAGTIGKVMLNVDLDASDAPPSSKVQVLDTDRRLLVDCMPCENNAITIPGKLFHPTGQPLWVRPGGLPGAADIKTYDAGNLWVSTSGTADNSTKLGELHLTYAIELSVPVLESTTSAPINNSVATVSAQDTPNMTDGVPYVLPLTGFIVNGIGATSVAGQIVLPAGNYLLDWTSYIYYSGVSAETLIQLQKNGVDVEFNDVDWSQLNTNAFGFNVSQTAYISSNGSDDISIKVTPSFSSGTANATGFMRIVAI
jgi:hypothetical protein